MEAITWLITAYKSVTWAITVRDMGARSTNAGTLRSTTVCVRTHTHTLLHTVRRFHACTQMLNKKHTIIHTDTHTYAHTHTCTHNGARSG